MFLMIHWKCRERNQGKRNKIIGQEKIPLRLETMDKIFGFLDFKPMTFCILFFEL